MFFLVQWVGCDNRTCRRWVHVECESSGGNKVDSTAFYLCPSCREVGLRRLRSAPVENVLCYSPVYVKSCKTSFSVPRPFSSSWALRPRVMKGILL